MTALLGSLSIAGYQNRDKIAEMLGGLRQPKPGADTRGGLGGLAQSTGFGRRQRLRFPVVDSASSCMFTQSGHGNAGEFWVKTGANKPCTEAPTRAGRWAGGSGHSSELK